MFSGCVEPPLVRDSIRIFSDTVLGPYMRIVSMRDALCLILISFYAPSSVSRDMVVHIACYFGANRCADYLSFMLAICSGGHSYVHMQWRLWAIRSCIHHLPGEKWNNGICSTSSPLLGQNWSREGSCASVPTCFHRWARPYDSEHPCRCMSTQLSWVMCNL